MKTKDSSWYCMVGGIVYPQFVTEEKVNAMLARFKTRNDDIFLVSYIKSGTTWLQQILLLLTGFALQWHCGKGQRAEG